MEEGTEESEGEKSRLGVGEYVSLFWIRGRLALVNTDKVRKAEKERVSGLNIVE